MTVKGISALAILTVGIVISACSASNSNLASNNAALKSPTPAAGQPVPPTDNAARISLEDAKKAFDDGTAVFIDTRAEGTYKQEHIKGSINIPTGSLDANIDKLSKSKKLIAYCS